MSQDQQRPVVYYKALKGYKHTTTRSLLKWALVVVTFGVFGLFLFWSRTVRGWFRVETGEAEAEMFVVGE
jgi:hypothetical protein